MSAAAEFWLPEYWNAFRMALQQSASAKPLLLRALDALPRERGSLSFRHDVEGDERLIVLLTHDLDNPGARTNLSWILSVLAETRALTWYGSESGTGPYDTDRYRGFSNAAAHAATSRSMLDDFLIDPLEYVAITSREPIFMWGIEDYDLYAQALQAYASDSASYWRIIERRPPVMLQNLLAKMDEQQVRVAGVWLTSYNFSAIHELLRAKNHSHAGVRAANRGPSDHGRIDRKLRHQTYDAEEAFKQDLLLGRLNGVRGWLRARKHRRRFATSTLQLRGQQMNVAMLKEYPIDRLLRRIRSAWWSFLHAVLPLPRTLSGQARRGGIALHPRTCGECGASFLSASTSMAVPLERQSKTVFDLGGYCGKCGKQYCPKHLVAVAARWEGGDWIAFAACGVDRTPVVDQGGTG
jgi:hypothetical protein